MPKARIAATPLCAELVANLAERFRPEFILLSGIAGGVGERDSVALGDVIVADHVEGYEIQKFEAGRRMTRRIALDHPSKYLRETIAHRVRSSDDWKHRIAVERPEEGNPKVIVGTPPGFRQSGRRRHGVLWSGAGGVLCTRRPLL